MPAVIPPADPPFAFQKKAGQVFEDRTDRRGEHKYGQRSFSDAGKQQAEQQPSCSINRKVWSLIDAPVDKSVLRKQEQQHFPGPARAGGNKKQKYIEIETVGESFFLHVLRVSDFGYIIL